MKVETVALVTTRNKNGKAYILVYAKHRCKNIAHKFLPTIDHEYVTLETKSAVAW
jgi:hypothetical protein